MYFLKNCVAINYVYRASCTEILIPVQMKVRNKVLMTIKTWNRCFIVFLANINFKTHKASGKKNTVRAVPKGRSIGALKLLHNRRLISNLLRDVST